MIPLFRPSCSDLEVRYVTETLRSGWWGMGPRVAEFEERFARYVGAQYAVAVSSCTAALQLTVEALDLSSRSGAQVIMPALTFASDALAVMDAGLRPVFADVDEDTLCLDWANALARVNDRTRAVMPVWYGGAVPASIPWPSHIPIIEDCAHAAGSAGAGRFGRAACWSFHAVKNLATGDGGMVTTDHPDLAKRIRALRWCGIDKSTWERDKGAYGWDYDITVPGHKAHMNDLTAALGLAQLERLDDLNKARRDIVTRYLDALDGLPWLRLPQWREGSSWHLFVVRVEQRDAFISHMLDLGVSAGVHYKPLNRYPVFGQRQPLPVTDKVWKTLVTLPLYPDMTGPEFSQVVKAVRAFKP